MFSHAELLCVSNLKTYARTKNSFILLSFGPTLQLLYIVF